MASAISSLPVPVSPSISTVASVGATVWTISSTRRSAALLPIMRGEPLPQSSFVSGAPFAVVASSICKDALRLTAAVSLAQIADAAIVCSFRSCAILPTLRPRDPAGRGLAFESPQHQDCCLRLPGTVYRTWPTAPRQAASGGCRHRTAGTSQSCLPGYDRAPRERCEVG